MPPIPTVGDLEYFERYAHHLDSIQSYGVVTAPGAGGDVLQQTPFQRGVYVVSVSMRISTGVNPTTTPDNYELLVGSTQKFRVVHPTLAANATYIVPTFSTKVRIPEFGSITLQAIAAEPAAVVVAANIVSTRVGDFLA